MIGRMAGTLKSSGTTRGNSAQHPDTRREQTDQHVVLFPQGPEKYTLAPPPTPSPPPYLGWFLHVTGVMPKISTITVDKAQPPARQPILPDTQDHNQSLAANRAATCSIEKRNCSHTEYRLSEKLKANKLPSNCWTFAAWCCVHRRHNRTISCALHPKP